MVVRRLKVVLTILAERSSSFSEKCEDHGVPETLFLLPPKEFFGDIDLGVFKKGIDELVTSKKELLEQPKQRYIHLIHKGLLVIFFNTTQDERQFHLKELLEHFYAAINENLIKVSDSTRILSKSEYQRLIRQCIPLVKLEIVLQLLKSYDSGETKNAAALKIAIWELYECIRFPRILREECYEIATKKLGSTNFKVQKFDLRNLDERDGNLGIYAKLRIDVECEGKTVNLHIFAKFLLGEHEVFRFMSENTFKKEQFIYTVFVPLLKQLGLGSLADFLPECYFVRENEVIFMEDLSAHGYSSSDVGKSFELEEILTTVKQFAKLHAASLLLEEKLHNSLGCVTTIDEYYGEYLVDMLYYSTNGYKSSVTGIMDYFLEKFPELSKNVPAEVIKERVQGKLDWWFETFEKKSEKYRNVVCHGDTWCNNIMFQHTEDGKIKNCYLVDYQLTRYRPPAIDVLSLIYITTDKKTKSKHMSTILKTYYTELKKNTSDFGVDMENICPFESFMECCESMKLAALFHSLMYLSYILIPKEKMAELRDDVDRMVKVTGPDRYSFLNEFWYHLPYRTRLTETIEEICKICENM